MAIKRPFPISSIHWTPYLANEEKTSSSSALLKGATIFLVQDFIELQNHPKCPKAPLSVTSWAFVFSILDFLARSTLFLYYINAREKALNVREREFNIREKRLKERETAVSQWEREAAEKLKRAHLRKEEALKTELSAQAKLNLLDEASFQLRLDRENFLLWKQKETNNLQKNAEAQIQA